MSTTEPGLFITKGMNVSIPEFSQSINESGDINSEKMTIHTGLDMCPYWIEIAYTRLNETDDIHEKLILAKNDNNESLMGDLLQKEFTSGMQAIMAGCIAIDSYYASIKDFAEIPEDLARTWRKNGTARYNSRNLKKDICNTARFVFKNTENLRTEFWSARYGSPSQTWY